MWSDLGAVSADRHRRGRAGEIDHRPNGHEEAGESLAEHYARLHGIAAHARVDDVLRTLDLVIAATAIVVLSPLLVVVVLALLVTSGRPLFYRGDRVGRHGRIFTMIKFRTLAATQRHASRPVRRGADQADRGGDDDDRSLAARLAARRGPATLERPRGRHEYRRTATDPAGLLRRPHPRHPAVLAAPRRATRPDRLRPDAHDPRGELGAEARTRPGVHRRPLRGPLPPHDRGDVLARARPVLAGSRRDDRPLRPARAALVRRAPG